MCRGKENESDEKNKITGDIFEQEELNHPDEEANARNQNLT